MAYYSKVYLSMLPGIIVDLTGGSTETVQFTPLHNIKIKKDEGGRRAKMLVQFEIYENEV